MRTTKIKITNLFGVKETTLDGRSIEVTGDNGTGKTSIIDAIKYTLTNTSERDYIIRNGEKEGEVLIETDTGLSINRKPRTSQSDYKSIKENGRDVPAPENFLRQLFTPLQIDPVQFIQLPKKEQNRIILNLIDFDWDLNWIKEQFGEIPSGINYEQNILEILNDIQSENGDYFTQRQDLNRDIRNKKAFIEDISKDIPSNYQPTTWENFDLGKHYSKLGNMREVNSRIERAKIFKDSYDNKIRGYEAEKEIAIAAEQSAITNERETLLSEIQRKKAEIKAAEDKLGTLDDKLKDKAALAESQFNEKKAQLDSDIKIANEYINKSPIDTKPLEEEIRIAEQMKKHLNEYKRMKDMQDELENLSNQSQKLTDKIELARTLPGEILQTAKIPIKGFTVKNGIPHIHELPVSNLSEGEKLSLCVDVALAKPNNLQIILIDGAEKLSEQNRTKLYNKCIEKGLQFIATRTTDNPELEVTYFD